MKKTKPPSTSSDDLKRRAIAAYFKHGGTDQPATERNQVEKHDGKTWVVLRNVRGLLAVYRLTNAGTLSRQTSWPESIKG